MSKKQIKLPSLTIDFAGPRVDEAMQFFNNLWNSIPMIISDKFDIEVHIGAEPNTNDV